MLATSLVLASGPLAGCSGSGHGGPPLATSAAAVSQSPAARALAQVVRRIHARLGVYVLDTRTGRTVAYQADQRFAYCSTFKVVAVGILLQRDTDAQLSRVIAVHAANLVDYSPTASRHVGTGMTAPRSHRDRAAVQRRHGGQPAPRLAPVGPRRSRRRCAVWGTARRMRTGPNQHFMRPSPATPLTPAPRARSAPTCAGSSSGTFCPKAGGNCSRPGSWGTPPAAPTSGPGSPPDGRSATRPATADTAPATTSPSPGRPARPRSPSPSCPTRRHRPLLQ